MSLSIGICVTTILTLKTFPVLFPAMPDANATLTHYDSTKAPRLKDAISLLTEHAFTDEYLSRFYVQSDDMQGTPANGPLYYSLPSVCRTKAIISTCFKDHYRKPVWDPRQQELTPFPRGF